MNFNWINPLRLRIFITQSIERTSFSSFMIEVRPAGSVSRESYCHICASLQDSIFKFQMDMMESKQECLDLCDTWTYDARLTFTSLADEIEDSESIYYNEVVLMVDPEYRMESDALKFDLISFFAAIGDGFSLFLGISLVTFVQAAYWGVSAIRLSRKRRLVAPS